MKPIIEKFSSFILTIFLFLFGDFDFLLKALLTLMCLDYITGICKSFILNKVNSSIGAKGIIKKVIYLFIITVSVLLDQLLNINGGLRTLIITSFIFNEILSILENSCEMGIKIPNVLYKALEKVNDSETTLDIENLKNK